MWRFTPHQPRCTQLRSTQQSLVSVEALSTASRNLPFALPLGALFDHHPNLQSATFTKTNISHISTAMLPDRWTYPEEVYSFTTDPRSIGAQVIMTVDPTSYTGQPDLGECVAYMRGLTVRLFLFHRVVG